jgi:hypothetical protein
MAPGRADLRHPEIGSLATNKQRPASAYETHPVVALAKELAGIAGQADGSGGRESAALPTSRGIG